MVVPVPPAPVPPGRPGTSALLAVLILAPLLTVGLNAAVWLLLLHQVPPTIRISHDSEKDAPEAPRENPHDKPTAGQRGEVIQKGTVKSDEATGTVYFPLPYDSPPHLTLTTTSKRRKFLVQRQDELSFTWTVAVTLQDVKDIVGGIKLPDKDKGKMPDVPKPPPLGPEDLQFTWEARGVRDGKPGSTVYPRLFEQKGSFHAAAGDAGEGEVHFPHPYASPPNVKLESAFLNIKLVNTTPTSFRWKNSSNSGGTVTWTVKGVRATKDEIAKLKPPAPPPVSPDMPKLFEQTGSLPIKNNDEGEISFPFPFVTAPNVSFTTSGSVSASSISITATMPTGFRFKNASTWGGTMNWTAKGVQATKKQIEQVALLGNSSPLKLLEQRGTFTASPAHEGETHFPFPYASPPNVALEASAFYIKPISTTTTGFRWKNTSTSTVTVTWTAKGVQATAAQVFATLPEQTGEIKFEHGEEGEVTFPRPFLSPPGVEAGHRDLIIVSVTATGFSWKDRNAPDRTKKYPGGPNKAIWSARGAVAPPKVEKK